MTIFKRTSLQILVVAVSGDGDFPVGIKKQKQKQEINHLISWPIKDRCNKHLHKKWNIASETT